jgi:hypothetical protein
LISEHQEHLAKTGKHKSGRPAKPRLSDLLCVRSW